MIRSPQIFLNWVYSALPLAWGSCASERSCLSSKTEFSKIESIFSQRSPSLKVFEWYHEKWFSKIDFGFGINWISVGIHTPWKHLHLQAQLLPHPRLIFPLVCQFKIASYCLGSLGCPEAVTGDWIKGLEVTRVCGSVCLSSGGIEFFIRMTWKHKTWSDWLSRRFGIRWRLGSKGFAGWWWIRSFFLLLFLSPHNFQFCINIYIIQARTIRIAHMGFRNIP